MFILDTIKPSRNKNILLETPRPIRAVSLLFTAIGYILLYLNIANQANAHAIYSVMLLIFILINMYFLLFHRTVFISQDGEKLIINHLFLNMIVKQHVLNISEIDDIYYEDRRMGQVVTQKLRFFVKSKGQIYNIGVVNHLEKADYIQNLLSKKIDEYTQK